MTRSRGAVLLVLVLVALGYFLALPLLNNKMLADQCAKDGGRLSDDGTICQLRAPVR
jgi:hypothetical protein